MLLNMAMLSNMCLGEESYTTPRYIAIIAFILSLVAVMMNEKINVRNGCLNVLWYYITTKLI